MSTYYLACENIEFTWVKDTLASDSWRFSGIFDINGCEKKLYHLVRLVKKFLFPCPEIRLRHTFYEKFVTRHNNGQSMSYRAKAILNKFLNGPGMNSRALEEKSQKSTKSEISKNALDSSPLMLDR